MDPEIPFIQRRLSGISRQMGGILKNLEEFKQEHPNIIAPNVMDAIVGNLRDDINVLLREMSLLTSPHRQQIKDRRWACRSCDKVFMQPLVAGICDECRSRGITTQEVPPPPMEYEEDAPEGENGESQSSAESPEADGETEVAESAEPAEEPETEEVLPEVDRQRDDPFSN